MLTEKQLDGIKPSGRTYRLWDNDRSGFGAQVTAKGTVTFFQQYRMEGKRRFMNMGRYPDTSLASARDSAAEARKIVQAGIDPQEVRNQKEQVEKMRQVTVSKVVPEYLEEHVQKLNSRKTVIGLFNKYILPAFGDKGMVDVSKQAVIELVRSTADNTPSTARQLLIYIKHFFDYAAGRGLVEYNPAWGLYPKNFKGINNEGRY